MQWYGKYLTSDSVPHSKVIPYFFLDPLNKFMLLKHWPASNEGGAIFNDNSVFEMIILPELEYPLVCVGVSKTFGGSGLKLELINTNGGK
jgi:hypothetical protein